MIPHALNGVYPGGSCQVSWEDGERLFCRGWWLGDDGERRAVLFVLLAAEYPSSSSLDRLAHEYGLKDELDGAWALRPLELVREGGRAMLVLEDAGGEPLDRLLGLPMEAGRFLRWAIGIAVALGKLHHRGLVHKDIKPANIIVNGADDQVRLTGFGLASRLPRERQPPDLPEFITGTFAYMAPEQTGRMNRSIDSRSDLYALGVTFYQMLIGALPFTAADPMEWVHCHLARRPVAPADRLKKVSSTVSGIIMKLLAKTAEDRYQTAAGLESDLRRCLTEWETQRRIDDFPLGEHDTSDRLLIPEKLYGRRREVETLLATFNRVVNGAGPQLALVSGYSGIGKSSVVNELYKELVPLRGFFASGKFDQYKRDIPYATLAQAFQRLIRPLLSKSEEELSKWRDALHDALGPNGRLIANLVPELQVIIGEPPPVSDLPLQDAQRRFQFVFRRFIGVFARPEHPLALFLDDLQWLDSATLDLIEDLLTQSDVRHLMLIGAYRDNEVNSSHPLTRKLEAIRKARAPVQEIVLAPLARDDLAGLIRDCFHRAPERATDLIELIHEKTAGNPFFAIQFVSALVEEGLLTFDYGAGRWSWDPNSIRAKGYADNVVDLMVGKLNRMPVETQQALQLLACMGNSVESALLEMVSQQSNEEMHRGLWEAIRAELIVRAEHSYRFAHDRIQETAYSLIPESVRAETHLRVGRLLAAHTSPEKQEEAIFEIVNQLNRGVLATTDTNEKARIARLNLQAGLRAKTSTAYASACSYFAIGLATLGNQRWEQAYELAFKLVLERAECELLRANLALSRELIELLLSKARSKTDRTEGYRLQVTLQLLHGDMALAVGTALECLKMFEMTFPERPTAEDVREEYNDLQRRMGSRSIDSLLDLPLMEDPEIRALSGILLTLGQSSYFVDEHLFAMLAFRMVKLSMDFGHSSSCIIGYGGIGIILGPTFGRFDDGERFARLAVAAAERHGFLAHRPGVYVLLQMASLWTRTIDETLTCLDSADKSARETDEVVFACISAEHRVTNLLARGATLDVIWPESVKSLTFVQKKGYAHIIDILLAIQRFVAALTGDAFNDSVVSDEATLLRTGIPVVQCFYWILQLQLCYLMGDAVAAIKAAEKAKPVLWSARCHVQTGTFRFYYALALCRALRSMPTAVPEALQEDLKANFTALRTLADSAPHTYAHKHTLVSAELAGMEGRDLEAMRLYEQAIRSALENGFIQDSAVGAELAADFFARRALEKVAQSYRREARELYRRWGALAKVTQLDVRHPDIAPEGFHSRAPTVETPLEHLDLATVIKVSQAVSGEIVLANLIDTVMRIAMAQAGAERALLILLRGAEPRVEAEATTSGDTVAVNVRDQAVADLVLPVSLLQYVLRIRESTILDDAMAQPPFAADPYIRQHQVRSVLCLPLINQGQLIGVLYLENKLTPGVFAPARIAVLKLLASQAAISLENTRLYRDRAEREGKIRRLVDANIIGIYLWDLEGRIVEANDAFLRMVGYHREDLASGRICWTALTPPEWLERDRELVRQLKTIGSLQPFEKEYFRKDGSRVPVLIGAATFEEGGNQGVAFVLDLTERKRAQEALRELESDLAHINRVSIMGELAGTLAHEITQPIAAARNNARAALNFLNKRPPDLGEVKEALSCVVADADRAGEIVDRIRDHIKKAPPRKERFDINRAINDVIDLARSAITKNGVSVQTRLTEGALPVHGDRVQVQQVLLNLILNAAEAIGSVEPTERALLISTEKNHANGVIVAVSDSGPGIHPQHLERVFEAFYTTKSSGVGMGLSICRSIIDAHGGRLWAEANEPRGAVFQFTLPGAQETHEFSLGGSPEWRAS
jgi:PAS domain S-box-containing protein